MVGDLRKGLITLYEEDEQEFSHNGLGVLNDAIKVLVTEELNNVFEVEMDYPETSSTHALLRPGRIIGVWVDPYTESRQLFRIYRISKPINKISTVYGQHISYDLSGHIAGVIDQPNLTALVNTLSDPKPLTTSESTVVTKPARTYTVIRNDSWWRIADRQLGSWRHMYDLAARNGKTIKSVIHPGDVLILEEATQTTTNNTNTVAPALKKTPFKFHTDTAYTKGFATDRPQSLRSIIGNEENSVMTNYEMDVRFDNFDVWFLKRRGVDTNVTISYGKNLTEINQDQDNSNVYTGVYPYWFGSADRDPNDNSDEELPQVLVELADKVISIPGSESKTPRVLDLDLSGVDFAREKTVRVKQSNGTYKDKVVTLNVPTVTQLKDAAEEYIEVNNLATAETSMTVSYQDLYSTSGQSLLDENNDSVKVLLGDTVRVIYQPLQIAEELRVIKVVYDALRNRYESIDLGEPQANLVKQTARNAGQMSEKPTKKEVESISQQISNKITGNYGGHVVLRNSRTGSPTNPDEILIMNTTNINTASQIWRWNGSGLGFSNNGYEGPYEVAITSDGEINANFIKTGELQAEIVNTLKLNASQIFIGTGTPETMEERLARFEYKLEQFDEDATLNLLTGTGNKFLHLDDQEPTLPTAIVVDIPTSNNKLPLDSDLWGLGGFYIPEMGEVLVDPDAEVGPEEEPELHVLGDLVSLQNTARPLWYIEVDENEEYHFYLDTNLYIGDIYIGYYTRGGAYVTHEKYESNVITIPPGASYIHVMVYNPDEEATTYLDLTGVPLSGYLYKTTDSLDIYNSERTILVTDSLQNRYEIDLTERLENPLTPGNTYTIRWRERAEETMTYTFVAKGLWSQTSTNTINSKWTNQTYTFTAGSGTKLSLEWLIPMNRDTDGDEVYDEHVNVYITDIKIEDGTIGSGWSPSTQDRFNELLRIELEEWELMQRLEYSTEEAFNRYYEIKREGELQTEAEIRSQLILELSGEATEKANAAEINAKNHSDTETDALKLEQERLARNVEDITNYIMTDNDNTDPEKKGTLIVGQNSQPVKLRLSNDRISFEYNESEIAYFADTLFKVKNIIVEEELTIGNFKWMESDATRNVNFTWIGA